MNEKEILQIFKESGALLEGHFELSSGLHSSQYLQCALVLQHPKFSARLGAALAEKFKDKHIDVVIGPALGGIVVVYEVAKALGVRGIFTERKEGQMQLRRGFAINPGEKVLVVEDVVTTGGSTAEVIRIVEGFKGEIAGIGVIVNRSGGELELEGHKVTSLLSADIPTYQPQECPLCKQGSPAVKPGSKK